jgi:LMBR1-like membrane protein
MKTCWYVIYMTIMVMIFGLLPFAQFFYETDDEKTMGRRLLDAAMYECCTLIIVGIALAVGY